MRKRLPVKSAAPETGYFNDPETHAPGAHRPGASLFDESDYAIIWNTQNARFGNPLKK